MEAGDTREWKRYKRLTDPDQPGVIQHVVQPLRRTVPYIPNGSGTNTIKTRKKPARALVPYTPGLEVTQSKSQEEPSTADVTGSTDHFSDDRADVNTGDGITTTFSVSTVTAYRQAVLQNHAIMPCNNLMSVFLLFDFDEKTRCIKKHSPLYITVHVKTFQDQVNFVFTCSKCFQKQNLAEVSANELQSSYADFQKELGDCIHTTCAEDIILSFFKSKDTTPDTFSHGQNSSETNISRIFRIPFIGGVCVKPNSERFGVVSLEESGKLKCLDCRFESHNCMHIQTIKRIAEDSENESDQYIARSILDMSTSIEETSDTTSNHTLSRKDISDKPVKRSHPASTPTARKASERKRSKTLHKMATELFERAQTSSLVLTYCSSSGSVKCTVNGATMNVETVTKEFLQGINTYLTRNATGQNTSQSESREPAAASNESQSCSSDSKPCLPSRASKLSKQCLRQKITESIKRHTSTKKPKYSEGNAPEWWPQEYKFASVNNKFETSQGVHMYDKDKLLRIWECANSYENASKSSSEEFT